jgi:hypothetical protein
MLATLDNTDRRVAQGEAVSRGHPGTVAAMSDSYRYTSGERLPVEVLVFEVDPEHVEEFLSIDHDVKRVGDEQLQQTLQARFDARFAHPVTLVRALHEESNFGIHRVSRFERTAQSTSP